MAVHRNDILWGGVLEDFFMEFLQFFFTGADEIFDFSKGFIFLDRTLTEMFPVKDVKHPRFVDKLVRVFAKNGKPRWFLIHIEVQGYRQTFFSKRVFIYYYKILEKYGVPVTCIVIYLGKRNKPNASFYSSGFLGTKIRFDFNAYYVGEQNEEDLKRNQNPFAIVVLTALAALKHKNDAQALFDSKITLAKNLLKAGFNKEKTRKLLNFIKLYIHFEENDFNIKFDKEIETLTNKKTGTMGILEIARELLKEQIKKEGKEEGKKEGQLMAKTAIARKLKLLGVSATLITKSTGLSLKRIKAL